MFECLNKSLWWCFWKLNWQEAGEENARVHKPIHKAGRQAVQPSKPAERAHKKSSLLAVFGPNNDTRAVNHILATSLSLSKCAMYRTWPTLIVTVRPEIYFGMRSHVRTCTSIYGHCDMGKRAYINNVICNTPTVEHIQQQQYTTTIYIYIYPIYIHIDIHGCWPCCLCGHSFSSYWIEPRSERQDLVFTTRLTFCRML